MKHRLNIFTILIFSFISAIASEKTTITFVADTNVTIRVFKPIDGCYNNSFVSDKLDLKPNYSINYDVDIDSFAYIHCEFMGGEMSRNILLFEGDNIIVKYAANSIKYEGDNAVGHAYYSDYVKNKRGVDYQHISTIIKNHIKDSIDFDGLMDSIIEKYNESYFSEIEKLNESNKVTSEFAKVSSKSILYIRCDILEVIYEDLMRGQINGYKPQYAQNIILLNQMKNIFEDSKMLNTSMVKYPGVYYISDYYKLRYMFLSAAEKNKLLGNYDNDTFGNFAGNLLAPKYLYPLFLAVVCLKV